MTANGAAGETLTQMESVLGLPLEELNAYLRTYADQLPAEKGGRCSLANSIWLRDQADRLTVEQPFLDAAAAYYDASVFRAPFDESTLRDINAWVSDHTGGLIPSIVEEIPESAVIYLINALAFEGEWEDIYREDQVHDGTFTTEDGREQPAELMYGAESAYLEDGLAAGFLKYYQGRNYAFAALLPNEGVSLDDYLASLTGEHLRDLLTHPQDTLVQTAIPKFTAETTVELNDALSALGMADAFDAGLADFSAMGTSPDGPLYISRVLHRTHLTLDERGTKAGAATAVEMDRWKRLRARLRLPDPALPLCPDGLRGRPAPVHRHGPGPGHLTQSVPRGRCPVGSGLQLFKKVSQSLRLQAQSKFASVFPGGAYVGESTASACSVRFVRDAPARAGCNFLSKRLRLFRQF